MSSSPVWAEISTGFCSHIVIFDFMLRDVGLKLIIQAAEASEV